MRYLILLLAVLLSLFLTGQRSVHGCVTDEAGDGLPGAAVHVVGAAYGTVADLDGCFSLTVRGDSVVLKVTFVGLRSRQLTVVPSDKVMVITLSEETAMLETVSVTAFKEPHIRADMSTTGAVVRRSRVTAAGVPPPPPAPKKVVSGYLVKEAPPEFIDASVDEETTVKYAGPPEGKAATPAAGQLTAGEANDFSKWELWNDISQEDLAEFRDVWRFYPDERYAVQITYAGGSAAADLPVTLADLGGRIIWSARTDNLGRAELWASMHDTMATSGLQLRTEVNGKVYRFSGPATTFANGLNTLEVPEACSDAIGLDVAFAIDVTGSMGDELNYLRSELSDVLARSVSAPGISDLRTAAVFYKDSSDQFVTRHQDFTTDAAEAQAYFNEQGHGGGGDNPEAVDAALLTAVDSLNWRQNAVRLLFLVLDAPPHRDPATVALLHLATRKAAAEGIRLIPVVCSGMSKDGEYLLRSMALATNGTYVFLTDDSGIGGKHLKPTTDAYEVEKLNDLLVRLITTYGTVPVCGEAADVGNAAEVVKKGGQLSFRVYPNPTPGPLTVRLSGREGVLQVFDLNGKVLRQTTVSSRRNKLNLSGLAAGTYVVRWISGGESSSQRVTVVRAD